MATTTNCCTYSPQKRRRLVLRVPPGQATHTTISKPTIWAVHVYCFRLLMERASLADHRFLSFRTRIRIQQPEQKQIPAQRKRVAGWSAGEWNSRLLWLRRKVLRSDFEMVVQRRSRRTGSQPVYSAGMHQLMYINKNSEIFWLIPAIALPYWALVFPTMAKIYTRCYNQLGSDNWAITLTELGTCVWFTVWSWQS